MDVRLSVIVPAYKVEAYLEKCLKSLAFQSFREMEVIVVNDGSPDSCGAIARRFAERFPDRFFAFDKENGGLSDARNFGVDRARGEYVGFLDGDDYLDLDACQRLMEAATEKNADLAACDVRMVYPNGKIREVKSGIEDAADPEKLRSFFGAVYPAAWNKIYRRSLLLSSGVRFKKGAAFEDVEFIHRLYPYLKSVASVEYALVNYVQREGSVTSKSDERLFDYLSNWRSILDFYREKGLFDAWRDELEYACARYLLGTFLKRARFLPKERYEEAVREAFGFVTKEFPDYRKNRRFYRSRKGWALVLLRPWTAKRLWKGEKA